ncbi:MAG TPA: hypothetical protein VGK67_21640 [Myxococcales bacterium]|jgi:hypothetical protein
MKNFAIAFAVVGALALAGCGGSSGGSCKKVTCSPACKTDGTEICDMTSFTCKALKTCTATCTADQVCDYVKGECVAKPAVVEPKTCTGCTGLQLCDTTTGTCFSYCTPVCDLAGKGEMCLP